MNRGDAALEAAKRQPPCHHCGEAIPPGVEIFSEIAGEARPMCCAGCAAVAEIIREGGLEGYYRHREQPAPRPRDDERGDIVWESRELSDEIVEEDNGVAHVVLGVEGMRCAACAWLIERHLRRHCAIEEIRVDIAGGRVRLAWRVGDERLEALARELMRLGFRPFPDRQDLRLETRRREMRSALIRLGVGGLATMQCMMFGVALWTGAFQGMDDAHRDFLRWMSALVAAPVIFFVAAPIFHAAAMELRSRSVGMNTPVALAIAATYAASLWATLAGAGEVYFESVCMFVFFLTLGRYLEMRLRHRAATTVDASVSRAPRFVDRIAGESLESVAASALRSGDHFVVEAGDGIAADGRIVEGEGWVDESLLSGEARPRQRRRGEEILAGSRNGDSRLVVEATRVGHDTTIATLTHRVEEVLLTRRPGTQAAETAARLFSPTVIAIAMLAAIFWRDDPQRALWSALSVLVASCPCALSLATPTAMAAALRSLLQKGILVTRPEALEQLGSIDRIIFDKTGTLTHGRLEVAEVIVLARRGAEQCIAAATALERGSSHPIARALRARKTSEHGKSGEKPPRSIAGCGVEGEIGGAVWRFGRADWASEIAADRTPDPPAGSDGWTLLADDAGAVAWIRFSDRLRSEARSVVSELRAKGIRLEIASGDSAAAVSRIADSLGISEHRAAMLPEQKLARVRELSARGENVALVGDGVNDAPAMAAAQVSIAVADATDLARTRADIVLLHDDLEDVLVAWRLARRSVRTLRQNLAWAATYNIALLPIAASGLLAPWWAALGMSASSLLVVWNSLRLARPPRKGAARKIAAPRPSASMESEGLR